MTTLQTIGAAIGLFVLGTACGYFALPAKVVIKTEVKTVTQLVKDTSQDKEQHTKVIVVTEKKPDGTSVTTTTKTRDTDTKTDTQTTEQKKQDSISSKETTYSKNSLSIYALAGYTLGSTGPSYGAAVSKTILGPISIGLFGLTNGMLGGSIGLNF